jgi:hypothetical protein
MILAGPQLKFALFRIVSRLQTWISWNIVGGLGLDGASHGLLQKLLERLTK